MQTARSKVEAVVRNGLHPHMRQAGYRKRGRTYRLDVDGLTQIVSVSSSVRDIPDLGAIGSYTVELGLYFPEVYRIGQGADAGNPTIHECYVWRGLPAEGWGSLDDPDNSQPSIELQTAALGQSWIDHGEAWLAAHRDPRTACSWAMQHEHYMEALYFSLYLKDWKMAAENHARCQKMFGGEWRKYIDEIAARYGLPAANEP